MKRVKVKKISPVKKKTVPLTHFYEALFQENKDLRVQVAHLQDELDIYKNKPNYWEERAIVLSHENEELKQKLSELEK